MNRAKHYTRAGRADPGVRGGPYALVGEGILGGVTSNGLVGNDLPERRLNVAAIAADATRGQKVSLHGCLILLVASSFLFRGKLRCRIVRWPPERSSPLPENPTLHGTKVPKQHSIPIRVTSAANDSGSLQTAPSKTPDYAKVGSLPSRRFR